MKAFPVAEPASLLLRMQFTLAKTGPPQREPLPCQHQSLNCLARPQGNNTKTQLGRSASRRAHPVPDRSR